MKKDTKRLLIMIALAIVMFVVLPILINLQPNDQVSIYGTQIIYLVVDMIFMVAIGWFARDFEKNAYLVPMVILGVAMLSQLFVLGGVLPIILLYYAEAAYLAFFIRKVMGRLKKKADYNIKQKPFPKVVKKR